MDLSISGRHVAVTDAMRERAREKAQRLEAFSRHLMRVKVTLTIEGERHMAEIIATVRRKGEVVAKGQSHDMYLSIDQAVAKMEKQLHKLEERIKERRKGVARTRRAGPETAGPAPEPDEESRPPEESQ